MRSPQADRVPGLMSRRGPTNTTGGHPASECGARLRKRRETTTDQSNPEPAIRTFNVLQWNAEGIYQKKTALTERLHSENIDVACVQETHLNPGNRFNIRGYQTFRMDREGRHKGGVLILVKNSIVAKEFELDTRQQAEIHGVEIILDNKKITLFNLYCPDDKDLSLQAMNLPTENCIVVGDFNSHSTSWGYNESNRRGDEVEDWQIENNILLINDPDDTPTFFSRRWLSTTTPDLAFATDDIAKITSRKVQHQLAGSDHRPVLLTVNINYRPSKPTTLPRWNYQKANWVKFAAHSDELCRSAKSDDYNINRECKSINDAILEAASKSIPRGARKNYKPYWTEELQELEDEVNSCREKVENNPTIDNNIALKASAAKQKKIFIQTARTSWRKKTESLNLDKDGQKLWKLTKAMNDEDTRHLPIMIEQNQEMVSGPRAANCLIDTYEEASSIEVPEERKNEIRTEIKGHEANPNPPDYMNSLFNLREMEDALNTLSDKKAPGPDKITNEMLKNLGTKAKSKLLSLYNNSWKTGNVPQIWREADMVPIHKKGKERAKATSYRPISLTSCVGKLMERLINNRLTWHLEHNNILLPEQAAFRHHRSTEDQVTFIAQHIEDGFQNKEHTLAVWIDMEKAFDKVWKDGLRLKLRKSGVCGHMYEWISQYLTNRKARVKINGSYSRQRTLREGVPQGGVLSPTLFLVYINDMTRELPRRIHSAVYADDLVIWCSEEYITTANYRMQQALNALENWTKKWLVKVNATKTTYTIFSLSTKEQRVSLKIGTQELAPDDNPTYLGVTFDKRLTWKPQTQKSEIRGKARLALMKKLAGTTWGADAATLKKLYIGRVRPVLEYGMSAWSNAAKTNIDRVSKVQNQAARIITGAMRSTPIEELETITGLQPMSDRQDQKTLMQAAKFKRLNHPMKERMARPTRGRLKRESFVQQSRKLERQYRDVLDHVPKEIPNCRSTPAWDEDCRYQIKNSIPGIGPKDSQNDLMRKSITLEHVQQAYPKEDWTYVFTDGSAEEATRNGGAGYYIEYPDGKEDRQCFATGIFSSNYKAEAEALRAAASYVMNSPNTSKSVVFLSDALSVLQALQSGKDMELNSLSNSLAQLCKNYNITLQWIPAHCGIHGNETADALAKEGSSKEQEDRTASFSEAKALFKNKQQSVWQHNHPRYNKNDPYHLLDRHAQVAIFRLRTRHNRLKHHMYNKFKVGETDQCPCGRGTQTTEHFLQMCPSHEVPRKQIWPVEIPLSEKLYGSLVDLQRTVNFVDMSEISI